MKQKDNLSDSNKSLTVKKKRQRLQLALEIEKIDIEIELCAYYAEKKRKCIFLSEQSDRYSEYIRIKKSFCNAKLPLKATWNSEVSKMSN